MAALSDAIQPRWIVSVATRWSVGPGPAAGETRCEQPVASAAARSAVKGYRGDMGGI
jgi:hypothetical protein